MAEEPKEYKSTDELKALFKDLDKSASRRSDFSRPFLRVSVLWCASHALGGARGGGWVSPQ